MPSAPRLTNEHSSRVCYRAVDSNAAVARATTLGRHPLGACSRVWYRSGGNYTDPNEKYQLISMMRKTAVASRAAIGGLFIFTTLMMGCSGLVETGSRTTAPSDQLHTTPTSSPDIGAPTNNGGAYVNSTGVVRAGSFPRAFLIPGTDTSIRIGG